MQIEIDFDAGDVLYSLQRARGAVHGSSLATFLRYPGANILQQRAKDRFANEGDSASGKWVQLAHRTQAIRAWQGYGPSHPINVRTRKLRTWVTSNSGKTVSNATSATMLWPGASRSDLMEEKFETAQVGGGTRGRAPARPVAAVDGVDLVLLLSGIGEWIEAQSDIEME